MPLKSGLSSRRRFPGRRGVRSIPWTYQVQDASRQPRSTPEIRPTSFRWMNWSGLPAGTGATALAATEAIPGTIVRSAFASRRKSRNTHRTSVRHAHSGSGRFAARREGVGGQDDHEAQRPAPDGRRGRSAADSLDQQPQTSSHRQNKHQQGFQPDSRSGMRTVDHPVCASKTCTRRALLLSPQGMLCV
jgi:hypothetical protein